MKRSSPIFLQLVIVLIGIGALALMLWEPHVEGRNAHATAFEIYFKDPFLAYAYVASIPFFAALYQAFKVLGYVRQSKVLSEAAVKALRTMVATPAASRRSGSLVATPIVLVPRSRPISAPRAGR